MKNLIPRKNSLLKKTALAALTAAMVSPAFAGWSVSGTQILDPKGNNFIYRGINHAHVWYPDRTTQALKDIAATGANSVRVVLANGTQWTRTSGATVTDIINQCKTNKLVCVLEVHDSTGFGESAAATNISNAASYWASADIKAAITGQEDYVIVNIANEPYGNNTSASTYTNETIAAIKTIRNAGITHQIMVDAPAWGQDWQYVMRDNAASIFAADPLKNLVFSVHMYEVYNTAARVQEYFSTFRAKGYPLIVGEFGTENNGNNVDEASIMQYAQDLGIGYMGWSWSGNGSCCVPLDIANSWNAGSLSTWGNYLINSTNGIKATSRLATHFGGTTTSASSSSRSSVTPSSSSVPSSIPATSSSSIRASSSSSLSNTGGTCNWYGTRYPICVNTPSGWGWENQQSCVGRTSCAALPAPWGIEGGTTSSTPSTSSRSSSSTPATSSSRSSNAPSSSSTSSASNNGGLSRTYVVSNSWGSGFTGAIRVTNAGTSAKSGWTASWQYSGSNRITSTWNATLSGSNPYSATGVSWNTTIGAGQTVEFGFQGNTNGGSVEMPAVTCR